MMRADGEMKPHSVHAGIPDEASPAPASPTEIIRLDRNLVCTLRSWLEPSGRLLAEQMEIALIAG
jgi:hypothetical protein